MTSHKSARICLNFVKYGCGLLSFHVIWVLALPAEEISSPRTSSKTGKNEKPFELKDVTSQDEDIQLGILIFALMVVCIAVSLALAVMSCMLKARTRQRDEMDARVQELQYILSAKVEEMKVHEAVPLGSNSLDHGANQDAMCSRDSHKDPAHMTEKAGQEQNEPSRSYIASSVSAPAAALLQMYLPHSDLAITAQQVPLPPSVPYHDHSRDGAPRTYIQERDIATPAYQVPLPPSMLYYDHSQGEAFTASPEVFVTPTNDPMPSCGHTPQDIRLSQDIDVVEEREEHCPPNVAWLTEVIVESPVPESARPAKTSDRQ